MISGFKTSARFSRMRSNRSFAVNSIATEYDTCEGRERESWWDGGMVFSSGTDGIIFDPNVNLSQKVEAYGQKWQNHSILPAIQSQANQNVAMPGGRARGVNTGVM